MSHNRAREKDQGTASAELDSLKRGEIDLDGYLEARMEAHLRQMAGVRVLSPAEVEHLRAALKAHCLSDPALRHYAALASGHE